MGVTPIAKPLPGEQVVALSPGNAAEAATVWLARPNLFAGRALTAPTLQRRQRWQAGRLALRGQALTPGVVHGLEVGHETVAAEDGTARVRLSIAPGMALAVNGEDVRLDRPASVDLPGLPVYAEPSAESAEGGGAEDGGASEGGALRARAILSRTLGQMFAELPAALPRIGVLVAQPVEVDRLGEFDPTDPCAPAACGDADDDAAVEDWRIADAVRFVWYGWPSEWRPLPPDGPTLRNALAWTIFSAEAALAPGEVLPWEMLGVPLALIALDDELKPRFIDRASVVRTAGRSRHPRLALDAGGRLAVDWRRAPLWQAEIEQLAEQIAAAGDPPPPAAELARSFLRLPPAGLLPVDAIDLSVLPLNRETERLTSPFFPAAFRLDAAPVPLENLDLALREAAPLAPLDMSAAERVRVLVPVPQSVFEPRLLHEELIDPEFQATLDRFLAARARALGARQGLRTIASELTRLVTGRALPVPALEDDPGALEAETLAPWGPPPDGGGHRSALAAGIHRHAFTGATAKLEAKGEEALFAWVCLDPDNPPRVLMLEWHTTRSWEHRAYWAAEGDEDLIPSGRDGTASRLRMGDLPEPGRWVRVMVPAAAVGVQDEAVDGMAFTLYDGRAAFGPAGHLGTDGAETVWFASALPDGAKPDEAADAEPWSFLTPMHLYAPFEPAFGFEPGANFPPVGHHAAVAALLEDPALAEVTIENGRVTGGVLSAAERAQLAERGVEGFIAFLKARADRADDLVDFGFVKVQTDTYRLRQLILGTTAATRLAVSPALATIAQAETAVASQERISTFFQELKASPGTPPAPAAAAPSSPPPSTGGGAAGPAPTPAGGALHSVNVAGTFLSAGLAGAAALAARGTTAPQGGTTAGTTAATGALLASPALLGGLRGAETFTLAGGDARRSAIEQVLAGSSAFVPAAVASYTPRDVVEAAPLVGKATIRTTSIAQRLEQPKALEAKDYATSTRHAAVQSLLQLADEWRAEDGGTTPGMFAGINVYGLANDPFLETEEERTRRFVPFTAFIANRAKLAALLNVPDREGDEAAHFSDGADLADNTVALLRQLEGRIKRYRDAIAACERVLATLRTDLAGANAAIAAWQGSLDEARHDVSVARSLMAEEMERLAAINARRAAVLREEVRFLAYVRPRETDNLASVPVRTLDPGLLEAPLPACFEEHPDVPDELAEMLRVLREAPAAWFVIGPRLVERLDRTDLLVRVMQSAQARSRQFALAAPLVAPVQTMSLVRQAVGLVQSRQRQTVATVRQAVLALDPRALASLGWQTARVQTEQVVSLRDLIDGEHGRGIVSRNAAEAFDRMSRIAACLHAELSSVLPAIRLDWAERLSQFDQAPSLRDLSVLARWAEIPYESRRRMQAHVDWLFDQVDARERRAEDLMNDVVRMCLLLAADAPIGRILAGRLPRPVVVRPGIRIPLTAFEPARLRIGMQALLYRGTEVVARAVVEDIGSEISARVVHAPAAGVSLDVSAKVQFAEAAQVSLGVAANVASKVALRL